MFYEINVSKNGFHFFATDERSIQSKEKLEIVLKIIKEKFPESEGYELLVTRYEKVGYIITE